MKFTLLATTAFAQFDYNPQAEYEDYNPDNSIARGVKFNRPTGDINQFGITSALSDQLNSLANDSGDIDFNALAQLLIQSQSSKDSARPRPTTTQRPTTTRATTRRTTRATTRATTRKQFQRTNDKKKATVNAVKPASKKSKQSAKKPTAVPKPTKASIQHIKPGFRVRSGDTSDIRGHNKFNEAQKIKFRSAAIQFAEKLQAYRASNQGTVFSDEGSADGDNPNSLLRTSMGDNNFGFYDYYDGNGDFDAFYDYAEQLIEEGTVGKNIDWSAQLRNEQVGENRAPIRCWTCKRTYWDPNSTGDLWADCRNHGTLVTCPNQHLEDTGSAHYAEPVSCQITEHKFFGVTSELEVGCKQTRACQNNWEQNRMAGSVYGRTCRVESTFGTSKCRQCCSTDSCFDGTTNTMDQSRFDQDSEWFDIAAHSVYNTSG